MKWPLHEPNYLLGADQDADGPGLPGTKTNIALFTDDELPKLPPASDLYDCRFAAGD